MKVLLFGATGMIGQGVLLECLRDPDVELVVAVGRTPTGTKDPKLHEIVHADLSKLAPIESKLRGLDACFFCLGVSSSGMKEADYERITYGYTVAAAETLSRLKPGMVFVYVSGSGTDSTEKSGSMWARVKGRTENAILRLQLKAFMFRPGFIEPLDGIESKTRSYRLFYAVTRPLFPLVRRMFPRRVLSTQEIGRAMLIVARKGYKQPILETADIRAVVSG